MSVLRFSTASDSEAGLIDLTPSGRPAISVRKRPIHWLVVAAVVLVITALTRASAFANPLYSADDQLYLLIGRAITQGQIPYVQIWDRKPIGIFLIYALGLRLGGDPLITISLLAGTFVAATTFVLQRIARKYASETAALYSCMLYPIVLTMFKGTAGQAQLFYCLPVALAALLLVKAVEEPHRTFVPKAISACLLCGVALTIRQTSITSSLFVGAGFVLLVYRRSTSHNRAAWLGLIMVFVGLAPTLASFAAFYKIGVFGIYFDSVFLSIFRKGSQDGSSLFGILYLMVFMAPLAALAFAGANRMRRETRSLNFFWLLLGWMAAALLELLLIPRFYQYYSIPLIMPLALLAAPLFERRGTREGLLVAVIIFAICQSEIINFRARRESIEGFAQLSNLVRANLRGGCLFIADGPPLLYERGGRPCATRFLFPDHLAIVAEQNAVGVDTGEETSRILSQRPTVIVLALRKTSRDRNTESWPLVKYELATHYRLVKAIDLPVDNVPQRITVWTRNQPAN